MDDPRIAKLPVWARELIHRLQTANEPAVEEIVKLRKEVEQLKKADRKKQDRIDAMVEMFQCAAKGGNEVATAVQRIVEDWIVDDSEPEPKENT